MYSLIKLIILLILGIGVLISYYFFIPKQNSSYIDNIYWLGIPKNIVTVLIVFQILALIGFIISIGYWMKNPPKSGVMSYKVFGLDMLFVTLLFFFISASLWAISLKYNLKYLTVISLIITAISSILLLAGSIEEKNPKIITVIGLLFLCITTVLSDGVLWNAKFITQNF